MHRVDLDWCGSRIVVTGVTGVDPRRQDRVQFVQRDLVDPEVAQRHHQGQMLFGDHHRGVSSAPGIDGGSDVAGRHHARVGECHGGMAGGQAHERVAQGEQIVGTVGEVGDRVIGRDESVGVVLALRRFGHGVVERWDDAADGEHRCQEALSERVVADRVAEGGEVQGVRRGSRRVVGQPSGFAVDDETALRQPDRGAWSPGSADRCVEVVDADVHGFADAGPVQPQSGKALSGRADAGEESLQHVALHLTRRVPHDLAPLAGKPVGALGADELVVGHAQHVGAAECVGGLVSGGAGSRRTADRRLGRDDGDPEASRGSDGE